MTAAFIRRLTLSNFRSYHAAQVNLAGAGPVVLTGLNGAGKTNLIEAISLLAPGRGLRRATMEELAFSEGAGGHRPPAPTARGAGGGAGPRAPSAAPRGVGGGARPGPPLSTAPPPGPRV